MCWNAEVSLQSFLFGMSFIGIGLYCNVSLPVLFFCFTIVSMQLVEYIVWSNYDDEKINTYASIAAFILLFLQPVASIFTIPEKQIRNLFLGSYVFVSLMISLLFPAKYEFKMKRALNGHLSWKWLTKEMRTYVSLFFYFIFLFTPFFLQKEYTLLGLSLLTLVISVYSFWKENTWGSMWCWIVNGIVPLSLVNAVLKL